MALGRILCIKIRNQGIGIRDRYGAAPLLKVERRGQSRESIKKRQPRPDITFNLLMQPRGGAVPRVRRLPKEKESILSTHLRRAPSRAVSTAFRLNAPKSSYPPNVKKPHLMSHFTRDSRQFNPPQIVSDAREHLANLVDAP